MLDIETVKQLLLIGEKVNMECKEAVNSVPKSVYETYSSFSNTDGGYIFLGVAENESAKIMEEQFVITGVSNCKKVMEDFWNTINSTQKVSVNTLVDRNVYELKDGMVSIVVIEVPRASFNERPVFINRNPYIGTYKRNNDGDYHCSREEVDAMIHADHFIFSNPGSLKLSKKQIYKGGNSKARNPHMQTMLRLIGYGDNAGSGFPTILGTWKNENWRCPDLEEDTDLNQVTLKLWMVSLMPEESVEEVRQIYGDAYEKLNHYEQLCLVNALLEEEISNVRLQEITELHRTDIGIMLAGLVKKNMLVATGYGRGMKYSVNREFIKEMSEVGSEMSEVGSEMSEVGSEMSEVGSEMSEVGSEMSKLERQRMDRIYRYMKLYESVSSAKVAEILEVGTKTASRLLNKAEHYGLLRSEGKTSNKRYFMV